MTGAGARKRHNAARKEKVRLRECQYRDPSLGVWLPRAAWPTRRGARRAIDRIYDLTGRAYVRYECQVCGMFHIKPGQRTYPPQPC